MGQKKSTAGNIAAVIIIAVILAVYVVAEKDFLFSSKPQDLFQLIDEEGEPTKGAYVSVDVDAVIDWYAETKHTINGIIPIGKERHYLIWLDDTSFISVTVKGKKTYEKIEDIKEETYAYLYGSSYYLSEPLELTGRISTMDSEIRSYYQEALDAWEISPADGLTVYYMTVDTTQTPLKSWLLVGFLTLVEVIAIVMLVKEMNENKMLKAQAAARAMAQTSSMSDENNNLYS